MRVRLLPQDREPYYRYGERLFRDWRAHDNLMPALIGQHADTTAADIHEFVRMTEDMLDEDVANAVRVMQQYIENNGMTSVNLGNEIVRLSGERPFNNPKWFTTRKGDDLTDSEGFIDLSQGQFIPAEFKRIVPTDFDDWITVKPRVDVVFAQLRDKITMHERDMTRVSEAAAEKAAYNEWCDAYDRAMSDIREQMSQWAPVDAFQPRTRSWSVLATVVIHIPLDIDATSWQEALDKVNNDGLLTEPLRGHLEGGNYDIENIEQT